jgi:GT2 family glycosyltransferase
LPEQVRGAEIAAVIPTVGRPRSLEAVLARLAAQTVRPSTVIVVHSGDDADTKMVCDRAAGLAVTYVHSPHRGAALQRDLAIRSTTCPFILLAEDDVEPEPEWIASLIGVLADDPSAAAAMGRMLNQPFVSAPGVWRLYRRLVAPRRANQAGAVVGALLSNGFPLDATGPMPSEWIGGGITLMRRQAYLDVGGFAAHFRGSSPGEDIELGFRLSREWRVWYVPAARAVHNQVITGREPVGQLMYWSMRSRYAFCRWRDGTVMAFMHIGLWAAFQTLSELAQLRRGRVRPDFVAALGGRVRGAWSCVGWDPTAERFPEWHDTHANA